jgi:hypothetical protein
LLSAIPLPPTLTVPRLVEVTAESRTDPPTTSTVVHALPLETLNVTEAYAGSGVADALAAKSSADARLRTIAG